MKKFYVECNDCNSQFEIEIIDGDDATDVICCPFCGNVNPPTEEIDPD